MFLTLLPAPKRTKLTPDVLYSIVIEDVKKNGGAYQLLKNSNRSTATHWLKVYPLRLFVCRLRLRSAPLYEWVEIWYVGSLWPSQAVFSIQLEHNTGQGHLRLSGKKGQPPKKNRDMALQYMFIGQIFAKNTKNDPKTIFEKIKIGQKTKIAKMGKFGCFQHVLCHNSAIFEDIDLIFCTHMHQSSPSNILHVFVWKFCF